MLGPRIVVVGSINLDLVARCKRLPRPGETVGGASFSRFPGGKGANQAVACARLGAEVTMIGAVGRDPHADEALAGLREAGIALDLQVADEPTGVALILVDASAGDAFTACLLVSLLEGRESQEALERACAAGALAASRMGAQPSLPTAAEVDAILAK
jgi:sugar/nucleoside kinase (ribokinase family)